MSITTLIERMNNISKFDYIEIYSIEEDSLKSRFDMRDYNNQNRMIYSEYFKKAYKLKDVAVRDFEADYTRISSVLKIYI